MRLIREPDEIMKLFGSATCGRVQTAVALGAFDGLHIGHKAVIAAAVDSPFVPVVFTFRDNPAAGCRVLTTPEERLDLFALEGVNTVIMPDFAAVAGWPAERFLNFLRFGLNAKKITCGADFRFGFGALGDVKMLRAFCKNHGIALSVVKTVRYKNAPVSATRIRAALQDGDAAAASAMLGRPFGFRFQVVEGNRIGRTIGVPTINQHFPEGFILPRFGVYGSAVHIGGSVYCGVTNVGVKPTVGSDRALSETWIPDFSGDLYGRTLRLELLGFIRDEQKFPDLAALKAEIVKNERTARAVFKKAAVQAPVGFADLHMHSYYSDGMLSPQALVDAAANSGVTLMAISDHDILEGCRELFTACDRRGIDCITAVEMNAFENGRLHHILAYGFDLKDEVFASLVRENRARMDKMNERFIRKIARDRENLSLADYRRFTYDRAGGGWKALHYLLARGVTETLRDGMALYATYGIGYEAGNFCDVETVCGWIHAAGAKAVLAHPGESLGTQDAAEFRARLSAVLQSSLDGVECYYPKHTVEQTEIALELCRARGLLITTGADCHGSFSGSPVGSLRVPVTKLNLKGILDF